MVLPSGIFLILFSASVEARLFLRPFEGTHITMRKTFTLSFIAGCALLCAMVVPASAQQSLFGVGPKVGLYLQGPSFMLGGVAEIAVTQNWIIEPGAELVFVSNKSAGNTTRLVLDGNVRYAFQIRGETFSPFVLGGPGVAIDLSSEGATTGTQADFRLNIGGGVTLNTRSSMQPWFGLKIYLLSEDDSDVLIQGGLNFYL